MVAIALVGALSVASCGKVLVGLFEGAARQADNVATSASKKAASEEAQMAASGVAHHADDPLHGPAPADEAVESPSVTGAMARSAGRLAGEVVQQGAQE